MKNFKKVLTLVLAVMMVAALCVTSVGATSTGSITIANSSTETTYTVYKVFGATLGENDAVSYTYSDPANFPENDYFECNELGTVTIKEGAYDDKGLTADAIAYIGANLLPAESVAEKVGNGKALVFDGLDFGYYYVSTGTGSAVTITTTNPDAVVFDKNTNKPGPGEDPNDPENPANSYKYFLLDDEYVTSGTASIGEVLDFYITFGAVNYETTDDGTFQVKEYKITDTPTGVNVDFTKNAPEITVDGVAVDSKNVDITKNTITLTWATEDQVEQGQPQTYTNIYTSPVSVVVKYSAEVIGTGANKNNVSIKYTYTDGTEKEINNNPGDDTTISNYAITINKVDGDQQPLTGAKFEIYDAQTGGSKVTLIKTGEGTYKVATSAEIAAGTNITTVIDAGTAVISGFGNGSYYLEETVQPEGYNILTERWAVTVEDAAETANVINNAGTILPGTGSIGTTLFVVVGALLIAAAGVLLVTNKRMNKESD